MVVKRCDDNGGGGGGGERKKTHVARDCINKRINGHVNWIVSEINKSTKIRYNTNKNKEINVRRCGVWVCVVLNREHYI